MEADYTFYGQCPNCGLIKCDAISSTYIYATGQTISKYKCSNGHKFSTKTPKFKTKATK